MLALDAAPHVASLGCADSHRRRGRRHHRVPHALHHAVQAAGIADDAVGAGRADDGADSYRGRGWAVSAMGRTARQPVAALVDARAGAAGAHSLRRRRVLRTAEPLRVDVQSAEAARYVDAGKATFVHDDDIVMAVNIRGAAVAYPILQLGYHHIVNDVVSGEPIVATY